MGSALVVYVLFLQLLKRYRSVWLLSPRAVLLRTCILVTLLDREVFDDLDVLVRLRFPFLYDNLPCAYLMALIGASYQGVHDGIVARIVSDLIHLEIGGGL